MLLLIDGVILSLFLTAGVFFLRYWRSSGERLYLMFAIAFIILGINRALLALYAHSGDTPEHHFALYFIRFVAFLIILVAIIDKNRAATPRSPNELQPERKELPPTHSV